MRKLLLIAALVQVAILKVQGLANLNPLAVYPLTKKDGTKDILGRNPAGVASKNTGFAPGPFGAPNGAYHFYGKANSFIEFPNKGGLDAKSSMTMCAWMNGRNQGPVFNYGVNAWGSHLWTGSGGPETLFVRFTKIINPKERHVFLPAFSAKIVRQSNGWFFGCASYDGKTGVAKIFMNDRYVARRQLEKNVRLSTVDNVRMGARIGDGRFYKGSVSCMQVYGVALTEHQIKHHAKDRCFHRNVPHTLRCKTNVMSVRIQRPTPYTHFKDLHLNDPACKPTPGFSFAFALDKCGTKVQVTPTHIIYTNMVVGRQVGRGAIISRIKDIKIKLKCIYPRKKLLTSNAIKPNRDKFRGASTKYGSFKFSIKIFKDKHFRSPFLKYPAHVHLRQPFFVQLKVKSFRHQLAILAKSCYATPSKSANDKTKYPLIAKSCPVDKTLYFINAPSANIQRFGLQAFRWVGHQPHVYIHCHVIVCNGANKNSVCAKGCNKKFGKREETELEGMETVQLTQGPFALHPETKLAENIEQDEHQPDEAVSMPHPESQLAKNTEQDDSKADEVVSMPLEVSNE